MLSMHPRRHALPCVANVIDKATSLIVFHVLLSLLDPDGVIDAEDSDGRLSCKLRQAEHMSAQ